MHHKSIENRKSKIKNPHKKHPIKPVRGEVYNAILTEGIGSELSGNHLVIIIQNTKGNIYGEKVNVIPIEGDGNAVNPNYQEQLKSSDMEPDENGEKVTLHKDPSRIIMTDILTIDKARLQRKIGKLKSEKMLVINKKLIDQLDLL
jgi:mRNA-degrading endonuclease toxin of MazEF toxin-antitoxin module